MPQDRVKITTITTLIVALLTVNLKATLSNKAEIQPQQSPSDLKTLMLNSYITSTTYTPPSPSATQQAQFLFQKLLSERRFTPEDVEGWADLGMTLQESVDELRNSSYAVISEPVPTQGRGHGFYAVKLGQLSDAELHNFLQAPHRPSDLYTHEIVFDMLAKFDRFGAAAWSTTHRNSVDLCKEPSSYYNSFTRAVAIANNASPVILQVHGFAKESQPIPVDIVFSSTLRELPDDFHRIGDCVKQGLGEPWVLLKYPEEVDFLGGTLNINADNFYGQNPNGKFIHFETSKELRDVLRINDLLKERICQCFQ